jgi:Zn-finger nucleic acid-binding protein
MGTENESRYCPECNLRMNKTSVEGVELDVCRVCSGIWFDHNELSQIVGIVKQHGCEDSDFLFERADCSSRQRLRPCPKCRKSMEIVEYDGVEVDVCNDCRGIWLDKGELMEIMTRTPSKKTAIPEELQKVGLAVAGVALAAGTAVAINSAVSSGAAQSGGYNTALNVVNGLDVTLDVADLGITVAENVDLTAVAEVGATVVEVGVEGVGALFEILCGIFGGLS